MQENEDESEEEENNQTENYLEVQDLAQAMEKYQNLRQ
jgi:hypothetical protein